MEKGKERAVAFWSLRRGAGKNFTQGHPWVFAAELADRSKDLPAGAGVELRDEKGRFLALGFGHPASQIAFRAVSRDPAERQALSEEGWIRRLRGAWQRRRRMGLGGDTFRLCFGEADQIPGLVVDRYWLGQGAGQVLVLQPQSAGAEYHLPALLAALPAVVAAESQEANWEETAVVVRRDSGARAAEGLPSAAAEIIRRGCGGELSEASVQVRGLLLQADLVTGQKTGLFLDQADNQALLLSHLRRRFGTAPAAPFAVADLFCYVGQWGSRVAAAARAAGHACQVLAADASAAALALAEKNIRRAGGECRSQKIDLLRDMDALPGGAFDLVILDPPALIKGKQHLASGSQGYLKLNRGALRLLRPGGWIASASCSAPLQEEAFAELLRRAAQQSGRRVLWVGSGGQAADHPAMAAFPEGRYLTFALGIVE